MSHVHFQHAGIVLGRIRIVPRGRSAFQGARFHPPTDVYETEGSVVITVEVAGLLKDTYEIALSMEDQLLTIMGRRQLPVPDGRITYHQLEIQQGEFMTQVHLHWALEDPESAEAIYENGCLTISLTKSRSRHIPVRQVAGEE